MQVFACVFLFVRSERRLSYKHIYHMRIMRTVSNVISNVYTVVIAKFSRSPIIYSVLVISRAHTVHNYCALCMCCVQNAFASHAKDSNFFSFNHSLYLSLTLSLYLFAHNFVLIP